MLDNKLIKTFEQGVKSGELTGHESNRLNKGQERIENKVQKAEADGTVTQQEKHKIEMAQNHQSRQIFKQKHDGQNRARQPAATKGDQ